MNAFAQPIYLNVEVVVVRNQRGAVLPLIAIGLVVILGIAGLAVDLNIALNSSAVMYDLSDTVSQAALERYYDTEVSAQSTPLEQHQVRLRAARDRANEILALTDNRPFYASLISSSSPAEICVKGNPFGDCSDPTGREVDGWLIPGFWFGKEPETTCAGYAGSGQCPCPGGVWEGPCFRELEVNEERVNAFQVQLKTRTTSPLNGVLGRFVGQKSYAPTALSIASTVPRRFVLLMDLSGSLTEETHPFAEAASGTPLSQATYRLRPGLDCSSRPRVQDFTEADIVSNGSDAQFGFYWDNVGVDAGGNPIPRGAERNGAETLPTVHFKDDYQCFCVSASVDPIIGDSCYLIDRYTNLTPSDPAFFYEGPQPQTQVFRAIHSALLTFQKRGVVGDTVQLIGFDREDLPARTFGPTAPRSDRTEFQDMLAVINPQSVDDWNSRLRDHLFFTRVDPQPDFSPPADPPYERNTRRGVFSNIIWALKRAHEELINQVGSDFAENNVVLVSDLLANCSGDPYDPLTDTPQEMGCQNTSGFLQWGQWHAVNSVAVEKFIPDHIVFHIMAIGTASLGYHVQMRPDNRCGCMEENQRRQTGLLGNQNGYTQMWRKPNGDIATQRFYPSPGGRDSGWSWVGITAPGYADWFNFIYDGNPETRVYSFQHEWYEKGVAPTGGVWATILPCCTTDPRLPNPTCADVRPVLKEMCQNFGPYFDGDGNGCPDYKSYNGEPHVGWVSTEGYLRPKDHFPPYIDTYGRLVCDAQGRNPGDQMIDYLRQIVSGNPFKLVGPARSIQIGS